MTAFLRGVQYLILDRDPLYIAAFRRLLRASGVQPLVLPAWSPNLNAFAERFVESAKSECLDRIVPLRIPVIVNGYSGHRDHRFRASRSLIGAKRRRQLAS